MRPSGPSTTIMDERRFGDAGAPYRRRGVHDGSGSVVLRDQRRPARDASPQRAGPQARLRQRRRSEHRRHGGVRAESARGRRPCRPRSCATSSNPSSPACDQTALEYRGVLYAGLMLTCDGPKVVEFNVRFGDPEAQVILPAIEDELAPRFVAAASRELLPDPLAVSDQKHVGVVMASRGLSGPCSGTGVPINGLTEAPLRACAGVSLWDQYRSERPASGGPVTAGGGVSSPSSAEARRSNPRSRRAYEGVSRISFDGMQFRRDIGRKAVLVVSRSRIVIQVSG